MAKNTEYSESNFHSPQAIDVGEDDDLRPVTVKLKGTTLEVASIDERWEEEEPETEWRDSPMTMMYYMVTLEDGQQLTLIRNMTYERWYYQVGGVSSGVR